MRQAACSREALYVVIRRLRILLLRRCMPRSFANYEVRIGGGASSGLHGSIDTYAIQTEPSIGGVEGNELSNIGCSAIDSQNLSIEALSREERGGGEDEGVEEESDSSAPACVGITPVKLALAATAVQCDVERNAEATKASTTSRLSLLPQGSSSMS